MTQEEKNLLLHDLCGRLPYGVIVDNPNPAGGMWDEAISIDTSTKTVTLLYNGRVFSIDDIKPYLRPMSSMTEDEKLEMWGKFYEKDGHGFPDGIKESMAFDYVDWLNERHFDYRRLIPSGLAIEVTEENNPYKD